MASDIGQLTPVDPREVWPDEARNFTPWLRDNADALSQEVGLDLELHDAEHPVDGFSLDLIGIDKASGERVIVENQLGDSDHVHLGQLMTYAGGTDAVNVIWIATRFREEHRAALEWLNERTDERTRFFAVKVAAVRIGQSAPAPLFSVEVRPNDWGKQVRANNTRPHWTEQDFFDALQSPADKTVAEAALELINFTLNAVPGSWIYWGEGQQPSLVAQVPYETIQLQPWSFSLSADGPLFTVNFDWIYKGGRGVPEPVISEFADRLQSVPGLVDLVVRGRDIHWRRRPSTSARRLFSDPNALPTVISALSIMFQASTPVDG